MKLRISHKNPVQLKDNFESVLNVAALLSRYGYLPTERDVENAENHGNWWFRRGDKIDLLSSANNDWVHIREESEEHIIFQFTYRYDFESKKEKTISNVILSFFNFVEEVW